MTAQPDASHSPVVAASPDAESQPSWPPQHLLSSAGEERLHEPQNPSQSETTLTDTKLLTFSERAFHHPLYVSL